MKKIIHILLISMFIFMPWLNASLAYCEVPLIHRVTDANARYMSGGAGLEERQLMEKVGKDFNLKLEFAVISGQYLAGIPISIFDSTGREILSAVSDGPWFWADLPKGRYEIAAVYKNKRKNRKVSVNKGVKTVLFHWKP